MSEILIRHFYDWFEYVAWAYYESEPTLDRMKAHPQLDDMRSQLVRDHVQWYRRIVGQEALPNLPSDLGDSMQYVLAAWAELIREADPELQLQTTDDHGVPIEMPVADVAMHLLMQSAHVRGVCCAFAREMGLEFPDTSLAAWRQTHQGAATQSPSTRTVRVDGLHAHRK